MDERRLLGKCYILLFLETLVKPRQSDSRKMIKEYLDNNKMVQKILAPGVQSMDGTALLVNSIYDMCNDPPDIEYVVEELSADIEYITANNKDALYMMLKSALDDSVVMTKEAITKRILSIRRELEEATRRIRVTSLISKTYRQLSEGTVRTPKIVGELLARLESEAVSGREDDPALVDKLDMDDPSTLEMIYKRAAEEQSGTAILKTGWEILNKTLQGGFRRGEFTTLAALQHNYKTGMGLSLFAQVAMCNDPKMIDDTKKPLLLRISLEDELHHNMLFLYAYLKYAETKEEVNPYDTPYQEMTKYVIDTLTARGYHIQMLRINPSEWTYRSLIDTILEYEAQGYEVHMCMVDYLSMIPTTGCEKSGPSGTDVQDMFKRVRNFFSAKKIAFFTPHQLSTEAKVLWREGIRGRKLLDEIIGGGYYQKSRQLDTEIDLELYLAKEEDTKTGNTYLHVGRGKHRGTGIIPLEDKYMVFKFPKSMPIPPDTDDEKQGARTVLELD